MKVTIIKNGDLVLPDKVLGKTDLVVQGDRIMLIAGCPPRHDQEVDASGKYVLPGLIDIHCHGRLGFADPAKAAELLAEDCKELPTYGVTRYLPTLASAPIENWHTMLAALTEAVKHPPGGAVPMGIHLEGNFMNPEAGGAHPGGLLKAYDPDDPMQRGVFEKWGQWISLVTFAPEVAGNDALIKECKERGIAMSLGHSTASPEEVAKFADMGVLNMCHLFNGMKPMDHRDPGPALGGLLDDRVSVEMIVDGVHVHPDMIRLVHRTKPRESRVLVSDLLVIDFPGVESDGPDLPNRLPNGRLAGSRLRLVSAVRNYMDFTGCELFEAAAMASLYPARAVGMGKDLGSIEAGKFADLVIADRDLNIDKVMVAGEWAI